MTAGLSLRHRVRSHSASAAVVLLLGAVFAGSSPQPPAEATTPTCVVPYLTSGASALVAGVTTVTAVTNNASDSASVSPAFAPWPYYFIPPSSIRLVLTFSPAVPAVAVDPEYNADGTNEQFTARAFDDAAAGTQVAMATALNSDVTQSLGDGVTANIARLEIDYSAALNTAALLSVLLPGTCTPTLDPSTQSVMGTVGRPLAATATMSAAGFGGPVTYAVTSGTLPAGLTLDTATGVVSGTPAGVGASTVTITGTGATSGSATATVAFAISEPSPPPADPTPRLALDCTPDPVAVGAMVTCDISNGDANIDILWSATTVSGVVTSRGVTLDASGSRTFAFVAPSGAEAIEVELVAWGVSDSVQVVGGPLPTAVPAGEGRGGTLPAVPLLAVATVQVLVALRFRTRAEVVAPLPR